MIRSWKNSATRTLFETGKSKFSGLDVDKALVRLAHLNAIVSIEQISPLRSIHLHKLKGGMRGLWAINVNDGWRIVFRFEHGDVYDVEVIDYHT